MSPPMTRDLTGSRLASPKIHKDSHLIHKRPHHPSSSSSSSSTTAATSRRHPVIIYTHTPKVIHADVKEFMTLVQKFTGRNASTDNTTDATTTTNNNNNSSSSSSSSSSPPAPPPPPPPPPPTANIPPKGNIEIKPADDSSSTSENGGFLSPMLAEMPPFFSHGSSPDLFCYPGGASYFGPGTDLISGHTPSVQTMNDGALSPSVIEAMAAYPSTDF